ncbi:homocysteine S-methyltransferase family protein [Endozoicomonas sp. G2_1]|uniref:homocysteine S-methyltransferase family protein n=1 Tax=Endozoicomonas sp. G2_1 TaxID=2821091 RepID=UPI001ADCE1E3|nr:homocysteine S-methyltransferase family protein [Endozoicomonas sp. G2_1]MBO9490168.1 homocysteine S-methyltransferase family protein [Endozoicomonas sp. G2_1]
MTSIILLDGGMGQELIKRAGVKPTPLWSAQVMHEQPHLVRDLHLDFIKAGAKVVTLNTYTSTPRRLARDASIKMLAPLHQAAKKAAKDAIAQSKQSDVRIAACLPPLLASFTPEAALNYQDSLSDYQQLVELQNDAADLFICETMSSIDEARAAINAAKPTNKPIWVSFVLKDGEAKLLSGETLAQAITAIAELNVDAVLINCSSIETINQHAAELIACFPVVGAYANAFVDIAPLKPGGSVDCLEERRDISPEKYAKHCLDWVGQGFRIIGGCCAIGPKHINATYNLLNKNGIKCTHKIDQ